MSEPLAISTPALSVSCVRAPWDEAVFGFGVAQIQTIAVVDADAAAVDFDAVRAWLDANDIRILSCRLPHDRLRESMFLEARGFRFIEMTLHPYVTDLPRYATDGGDLMVLPAAPDDLDALVEIAEHAFTSERYHVDPRLDARLADRRYGRWVQNAFEHPTQRPLKIVDGDRIVALFVVEDDAEGGVYWHLTCVAPGLQGQGYGRRTWLSVLSHHRQCGRNSVSTTIAARNTPVLNLYSQLRFKFRPPKMTFHWLPMSDRERAS